MPLFSHLRRAADESSNQASSNGLNPVEIAGTVTAIVLFLSVITWLTIRWNRKRNIRKREADTAAFLAVRQIATNPSPGQLHRERGGYVKPQPYVDMSQIDPHRPSGGIAFPQPVITPSVGPGSREEMVKAVRHASASNPKPFSVTPGGAGPSPVLDSSPDNHHAASWVRRSFLSVPSGGNRFSVMSSNSLSSPEDTTGNTRKVRQLFTPLLADELLLAKVGEPLVVLQSFDDGWCLVGRENTSLVQQKMSMFKTLAPPSTDVEQGVELGAVPAWCFTKPTEGFIPERPTRISSLGVTVQIKSPGASSRRDIVSWSNF